ncbi:MAG: hypothetical protein WCC48_12850 [Anaeromyxobacteraceae bacterium]
MAAALLVVLVGAGSAYLVRHRRLGASSLATRRSDPARRAGEGALAGQAVTATCVRATATVEMQRGGSGEWRPLGVGEGLRGGDLVRTGPASSGRIDLVAGGYLELEENATIAIGVTAPPAQEGPGTPAESTVAVHAGIVRGVLPSAGDARPRGLVVRGPDGSTARFATAKGSEPAAFRLTRAAGGTEVAITEGEVDVGAGDGGQKLRAGRAIDLPARGGARVVELPDFPASVEPGIDARFRWRKGLEIRLAWKKVSAAAGYRVQVSRSLSFETVDDTFEVDASELPFKPKGEGMFAWRVASRDDAGRLGEYGFARRVYCDREASRDLLVGPADRETVRYTDARPTVAFTWQSAANARSYTLVVATSPKLRARAIVNRVTVEQRAEVKGLAPGSYYWGVFAGEGQSAKPIFQSPRSLVVQRVAKAAPAPTTPPAAR